MTQAEPPLLVSIHNGVIAIAALLILFSLLASVGYLGYQAVIWAQTGVWHSITIADEIAESLPYVPIYSSGWIGIDEVVNDEIQNGKMWVFFLFWFPIFVGIVGTIVGTLLGWIVRAQDRHDQ